MAQYIRNITTLRSGFNCHVLIIHHSGKDKNKGARGHTSLRAAVDTEIEINVTAGRPSFRHVSLGAIGVGANARREVA